MKKKEIKNCWEFWGCGSECDNCLAFINKTGQECWLVANTFSGFLDETGKKRMESCCDCPWFKKMNKNGCGVKKQR